MNKAITTARQVKALKLANAVAVEYAEKADIKDPALVAAAASFLKPVGWQQVAKRIGVPAPSDTTVAMVIAILESRAKDQATDPFQGF